MRSGSSVVVGVSALCSIVLGEAHHGPHITARAFKYTQLAPRAHSEHTGLLGLFPYLRAHSKLAIRQAVADNTTASGGSGEYGYGLPEKCADPCKGYAAVAMTCAPGETSSAAAEDAQMTCLCTKQTFEAVAACAKCYPDWFTEENGSVADGIQSAVDECTQSGHPVTDLDQASIASALTASAASTSDGGSSTSSTGGSTTSVSQATSASTSSGSTQSQSAPPNAAGKTAVGGSIALIMLTVAAYSLV